MKLIIKAAAVLALAVALSPTVVRLQARWNEAKPRIEQEQARARAVVETVRMGVEEVRKTSEEVRK